MKKIRVLLEAGKDGYGVSFDEIPNVFGFGESIEAAKDDAKNVLDDFVKVLKKTGNPVPEILTGEYELYFEFDTESLLKHVEGIIKKTALAKISGINPSQLTHYSSGLRKPRPEQREKIIKGLHKLGQELLSVS